MSIDFNSYSEFEDWCAENGYDPENEYDLEESPHKRNTLRSFYVQNTINGEFASVTLLASYDYGWSDVVVTEGFERNVERVVTEKVTYEQRVIK